MSHAARHFAEEIEFASLLNLGAEPDLVDDEAEIGDERDEQADVVGRVRFVGFVTEQEESEDLAFRGQGKDEAILQDAEFLADFHGERRSLVADIFGIERQVFAFGVLEVAEDRGLGLQLVE